MEHGGLRGEYLGMNDNILYHALATRPRTPRPDPKITSAGLVSLWENAPGGQR